MALVRGKGNKSTEQFVSKVFRSRRVSGWRRHPKNVFGRPDFYFPRERVAVFIDGCFWHGCGKCGRIPKSNIDFWMAKIESNKKRDMVVKRELKRRGITSVRVWEHELKKSQWFKKIYKRLAKVD